MSGLGSFFGIGVGPGEAGLIPVAAFEAIQKCHTIFTPKAKGGEFSVARDCLRGLNLPAASWREVEFQMDENPAALGRSYDALAKEIAAELTLGRATAYLTLGDPLTYSTYGYTLQALLKLMPTAPHKTFPGITSFAALAAATHWPLGEGKERVLILPCPDDMRDLERDIQTHDTVILMKIGKRLPAALALLRSMGIAAHCAFGKRVGMPDQIIEPVAAVVQPEQSMGYLSTLLIRKEPRPGRGN